MYVEGVTFSAKVNVVAAGAEEKTLMVRDLLVSLAFFLTGAVVSVSWTRLQEEVCRDERLRLAIDDLLRRFERATGMMPLCTSMSVVIAL